MSQFERINTKETEHRMYQHLLNGAGQIVSILRAGGFGARLFQRQNGRVHVIVSANSRAPTGEIYNIG